MQSTLGWRRVFAVLGPSTNTVVEPDFNDMRVPGVTVSYSRIWIDSPDLRDDRAFQCRLLQLREGIGSALARALSAEPDYLIMGVSAETFWEGREGNRRVRDMVRRAAGDQAIGTGADACARALRCYGARRIGVITPYQPIGDTNVRRFFEDLDVEVVRMKGLRCPDALSIARVSEATLREAICEVNNEDVEAIVQVGANLSMLRLADEAERWLGKPVIAINAATWWMALRESGIPDRIDGFGGLLAKY